MSKCGNVCLFLTSSAPSKQLVQERFLLFECVGPKDEMGVITGFLSLECCTTSK